MVDGVDPKGCFNECQFLNTNMNMRLHKMYEYSDVELLGNLF